MALGFDKFPQFTPLVLVLTRTVPLGPITSLSWLRTSLQFGSSHKHENMHQSLNKITLSGSPALPNRPAASLELLASAPEPREPIQSPGGSAGEGVWGGHSQHMSHRRAEDAHVFEAMEFLGATLFYLTLIYCSNVLHYSNALL